MSTPKNHPLAKACKDYVQKKSAMTITDIAEGMKTPLRICSLWASTAAGNIGKDLEHLYDLAYEERAALEQAIVTKQCRNVQEAVTLATVLRFMIEAAEMEEVSVDTMHEKDAALQMALTALQSILGGMKLSGITAPKEFTGWYGEADFWPWRLPEPKEKAA